MYNIFLLKYETGVVVFWKIVKTYIYNAIIFLIKFVIIKLDCKELWFSYCNKELNIIFTQICYNYIETRATYRDAVYIENIKKVCK